jgi:hypothetical protein
MGHERIVDSLVDVAIAIYFDPTDLAKRYVSHLYPQQRTKNKEPRTFNKPSSLFYALSPSNNDIGTSSRGQLQGTRRKVSTPCEADNCSQSRIRYRVRIARFGRMM